MTLHRRALLGAFVSAVASSAIASPLSSVVDQATLPFNVDSNLSREPLANCDTKPLDRYIQTEWPNLVASAAASLAAGRMSYRFWDKVVEGSYEPRRGWLEFINPKLLELQTKLKFQARRSFIGPRTFMEWGGFDSNGNRVLYHEAGGPNRYISACSLTGEYYDLWQSDGGRQTWKAAQEVLAMFPSLSLRGIEAAMREYSPALSKVEKQMATKAAPIVVTAAKMENLISAYSLGLALAIEKNEFWLSRADMHSARVSHTFDPMGESAAADHVRRVIESAAVLLDQMDYGYEKSLLQMDTWLKEWEALGSVKR